MFDGYKLNDLHAAMYILLCSASTISKLYIADKRITAADWTLLYFTAARGGYSGGGIKLIVGLQPLMVISLTASWIRWCMQVYVW